MNIRNLMAAVAVAHFNKTVERARVDFLKSKKGRALLKAQKRSARSA